MFSLYLYFMLHTTRDTFRSLMTVLILFITEEHHLKRNVGTYCYVDAAQRGIWRDIPRPRSPSKAHTMKQNPLLYRCGIFKLSAIKSEKWPAPCCGLRSSLQAGQEHCLKVVATYLKAKTLGIAAGISATNSCACPRQSTSLLAVAKCLLCPRFYHQDRFNNHKLLNTITEQFEYSNLPLT